MSGRIGKDMPTVRRNIRILKGNRVIKRVGSNKTGSWKIIK